MFGTVLRLFGWLRFCFYSILIVSRSWIIHALRWPHRFITDIILVRLFVIECNESDYRFMTASTFGKVKPFGSPSAPFYLAKKQLNLENKRPRHLFDCVRVVASSFTCLSCAHRTLEYQRSSNALPSMHLGETRDIRISDASSNID